MDERVYEIRIARAAFGYICLWIKRLFCVVVNENNGVSCSVFFASFSYKYRLVGVCGRRETPLFTGDFLQKNR